LAIDQGLHKILFEPNPRTHRHVRRERGEYREPTQQQILPQSDATPNGQRCTKSTDDADLVPRLLDGASQQRGVPLKLLAGRS